MGGSLTASQAPLPDLSSLQGLEPGVAYAALAVIALGMLLFYLGPGLRQRFTRPDPPAAVEAGPSGPLPPALPATMDQANVVYDRFVDHLQQQLGDRDRTIAAQDRELARLRTEIDRLRGDLERVWDQMQRGGRG
jgi:hypothetical protein